MRVDKQDGVPILDIGSILNDPANKLVVDAAIRVGVRKVVDALLSSGDKFKKLFQGIDLRKLDDQFEKLNRIRTIANPQYDQQIREIYFPLDLTITSASTKTINHVSIICLDDLPVESNFIFIEGLAGQGKSTLLKQMATTEIMDGYRLPIFLEFRKISSEKSIEENLINLLNDYGIAASLNNLKDILSHDRIVLMLDGFDEVPQEKRSKTIRNLESLIRSYSPHKIFVTSRPNTELEYFPVFDRARIDLLSGANAKRMIEHLCIDKSRAKQINSKISKKIEGVLVTPLLVTLLLFSYNSGEDIPDALPDFYQKLFYVLIKQHDFSKTDYSRPRKTKLGDNDLQKVFSALCYGTYNEGKTAFGRLNLMQYAERALDLCDLKKTSQDDLIEDIVNITNLILIDGLEYEFIHKSIQEYYAACFLYSRSETVRVSLYQRSHSYSFYLKWASVINFLSYIDRYNYVKYLALPLMDAVFEKEGSNLIKQAYIEEILDKSFLSDGVDDFLSGTENLFSRTYIFPVLIDLFEKFKQERFNENPQGFTRNSVTSIRKIMSAVNKNMEIKRISLLYAEYRVYCEKQENDNSYKIDF